MICYHNICMQDHEKLLQEAKLKESELQKISLAAKVSPTSQIVNNTGLMVITILHALNTCSYGFI